MTFVGVVMRLNNIIEVGSSAPANSPVLFGLRNVNIGWIRKTVNVNVIYSECPKCRALPIDNTCFCDWPENQGKQYCEVEETSWEEAWFPQSSPKYRANLKAKREGEKVFREKLKSINFSKVRGRARGE